MSGLRVFVCPECGEQRRLSTLTAACEGCGGDRAPVEVEVVPRGVADRLAEAAEAIDRLQKKWQAPLRAGADDRDAADRWAAVGSEAHKIARAALAAYREETKG